MSTEETLVEHVMRIKQASAEPLTTSQIQAALAEEGMTFETSQVKKAASKATKRIAHGSASPAAPAVPEDATVVDAAAKSKNAAKRAAAAAEALKAAEAKMMSTQKALRDRWMHDGMGNAPGGGKPTDTKSFIEHAAAHAISGTLTEDEAVSRERVEADVAMLHWILHPNSTFAEMFPSEDDRKAARAQLDKLEELRSGTLGRIVTPFLPATSFGGARSGCVFKSGPQGLGYYHEAWFHGFSACYVAHVAASKPYEPSVIDLSDAGCDKNLAKVLDEVNMNDSASLDRVMAKANALAAASSGSAMDDMD
eukprot:CAMPEP_0174716464 /NCGR_PEP_ID=MMETSP1094-20130205/24268_1 /TAXON_ID=156173 /ORGANISM="Chrysochromulina brevifilum, Strain UTEX LB 985" /LENGTH=308 /DNA_ID=CAMNT_0015916229 /DNA_START=27 /DNA_END=953 /DNA_ORIENTATION=-